MLLKIYYSRMPPLLPLKTSSVEEHHVWTTEFSLCMLKCALIVALLLFVTLDLQMRMSARWGTPVLMPATTSWAPTTALVPEASPSQLTAGRVKVDDPKHFYHNLCQHHGHTSGRCWNDEIFFVPADIDECSLGENVCHDAQDCMNTIGSYRCVMRCGRGFRRTADGFSCTGTSSGFIIFLWAQLIVNFFFDNCLLCHPDVNECQESDPCNQICFNTIGSYRCACEPGFQLRNRRCIGEIFRLSDVLYVCVA